jgi:hypothetical protein
VLLVDVLWFDHELERIIVFRPIHCTWRYQPQVHRHEIN